MLGGSFQQTNEHFNFQFYHLSPPSPKNIINNSCSKLARTKLVHSMTHQHTAVRGKLAAKSKKKPLTLPSLSTTLIHLLAHFLPCFPFQCFHSSELATSNPDMG